MTPEQKIKWLILAKVAAWEKKPAPEYPRDNIDELYNNALEWDITCDARNAVRYGEVETKLECDWSRHYESEAVATKMPDGSWVGWTRWEGGGKHGEPEAMPWMEDAYDLDCKEEEKLVVVRTFKKK